VHNVDSILGFWLLLFSYIHLLRLVEVMFCLGYLFSYGVLGVVSTLWILSHDQFASLRPTILDFSFVGVSSVLPRLYISIIL